ncbi:MAG: hypothetical protein M0Z76_07900 [Gammaproteobacteria bacterium]|nr:hypothetical protein [Gammaproteobacteria bacterium]
MGDHRHRDLLGDLAAHMEGGDAQRLQAARTDVPPEQERHFHHAEG